MTKLNFVKSAFILLLALGGISSCGGGGGTTNASGSNGGFTSSTPNTKPQTSSSAISSSQSISSSSTPATSSSSSSKASGGADLIPPTVPANFAVGLQIYDAVGLNWSLSTDNIAVMSYKIYRDNVQIGDAADVDSTFLDFDVAPDKNYTYGISAIDAVGNASAVKSIAVRTPPAPVYTGSSSSFSSSSANSSNANSSVISSQSSKSSTSSSAAPDKTPPEAPKNLVTTALFATQVDLEWSPGTDNQSVAAYRIYRDGVLQTTVKADTLIFSDKNVSSNKSYSYAIETVDGAGNTSLSRKTLSVTTPAAITNGDVTLYWAAPTKREDNSALAISDLAGYIVRYKAKTSTIFQSLNISNSATTSFIIPNLVGDYEFQIAAYDKNNLSSSFINLPPH